jgi:DNA primase
VPDVLARDQFAAEASQKLGIGSSIMREELRQAALRRRDRVETRPATLTEVERVLLRALANTDMEGAYGRHLAAEAVQKEPSWFEHLASFAAMQALAIRKSRDPMEVVEDAGQKALLAEALLGETRLHGDAEVESALQEVEERAIESLLRELRGPLLAASRDQGSAEWNALWRRKLELDRALKELQNRKGSKS